MFSSIVVLDNLSVHKSKRVQKEISKCCPRIKFVFLSVRWAPPELNLIEVNWLWLQRQAINNSTFKKDEQEIGRAVSKWRMLTIKIMAEQSQIFYKRMYLCVYITVNLTIISPWYWSMNRLNQFLMCFNLHFFLLHGK